MNESLREFYEVKDLYLEEKLTQEEIEYGLDPYSDMFKVGITRHAYNRMNEDYDRFCDWSDVEYLLLQKANEIINTPQNEEVVLMRDDCKLAVIAIVKTIEGFSTIIIQTVIRKVYFDNCGNEQERRVFIDRSKNKVI